MLPIVAADGVNVPVAAFVMPDPLHVPPAGVPTRLTAAASAQNGPAGVIAGGVPGFTVTVRVMVALHDPFVTINVTEYVPAEGKV